MGLDITYCRKARKVSRERFAEAMAQAARDGEADSIDVAYRHGWRYPFHCDFPERADDIEDRAAYEVEDVDGFPAGSYSGFMRWRKELAALVGITDLRAWWNAPATEGPFVELLNMSDCEGVIGPRTAAKLRADFVEWRDRAAQHAETIRYGALWLEKYDEWSRAFEVAQDGGFVEFH